MSDKVWERLWKVLETSDEGTTVYVYRLDFNGNTIKPCLLKCEAWPELLYMLRDDHGGGQFKLLIRKKRLMVFSGEINIIRSTLNVTSVG